MMSFESEADAAAPAGHPAAEPVPGAATLLLKGMCTGPGIIETDLGEELILLDPATQQMFSLNGAGRFIWNAHGGGPADTVVDRVVATFVVARESAEADVRALVRHLLAAGLIVAA